MPDTVTRKRLEILADTALLPRVVEMIERSGISGYSIVRVAAGGSRASGKWSSDDFTGASAKSIVIALASAEKAEALTTEIAPLLTSQGFLLTIGDVEVVRGERF
ncbi:hypothetical protein HME9302_01182 [Alteripontixanthobacter maritimus]|uniref:Nitrogen regulatory protein P-II n=1 Tax=Alteripontixanthobacter maritimus TaxID=2161824 RepID=A0A369Q5I7_9SPHN|nr:transcriptional regulator [Alteripontixanthobacter maritimus]RDC59984.1 hypothetical protein HME9302_01182 [Alteripontixanthobacter maritimus]